LNRAIYVAENSASEMRKAASNEAKMIIDDAKRNASRIVNDSLVKAAETDAQVDKLKTQIKIYKARIKQTIEEQLIMVDDIDKIEF
jgi:cell division initiation protein